MAPPLGKLLYNSQKYTPVIAWLFSMQQPNGSDKEKYKEGSGRAHETGDGPAKHYTDVAL